MVLLWVEAIARQDVQLIVPDLVPDSLEPSPIKSKFKTKDFSMNQDI